MNPRITKEIKVLLPALLLTLAAALMAMVIGPNRHELTEIWMGIIFAMGCLIMGAESFGMEFHQRTMPLLLTQPIPRSLIWREKMQVLGAALVIGTGTFVGAVVMFDRQIVSAEDFSWVAWLLIPVGILCATPYWTLLLRNSILGALFTFLAPVLLLGLNSYLHDRWLENGKFIFRSWFVLNGYLHQKWIHDPAAEESSVITLLILYCAVCCWLGYRRFTNLQVVDAQGTAAFRELGLPAGIERVLLRPFKALAAGFTGPLASLVKKELRLQQVTFIGAGLFCLIAVAGALLFQLAGKESGRNWAVGILVSDFYLYLLVLPFVAGAVAVAEEKVWGVADWHLTLPPSALKQWSTKVSVALAVSFVLGLLLPAALIWADTALFGNELTPGAPPPFQALRSALSGNPQIATSTMAAFLFCLLFAQMMLASIAVYAASLTSTTARALILALGMMIATVCVLSACVSQLMAEERLQDFTQNWPFGPLAASVVLSLGLIHYLAYRCFRTRGIKPSLLRLQVPLVVLILCFSLWNLVVGLRALARIL